jgi:hypothetical protein
MTKEDTKEGSKPGRPDLKRPRKEKRVSFDAAALMKDTLAFANQEQIDNFKAMQERDRELERREAAAKSSSSR